MGSRLRFRVRVQVRVQVRGRVRARVRVRVRVRVRARARARVRVRVRVRFVGVAEPTATPYSLSSSCSPSYTEKSAACHGHLGRVGGSSRVPRTRMRRSGCGLCKKHMLLAQCGSMEP